MIENKVTFKLMTRKIFETWLVALLLGLATFTGCNSLEITMPIGPKGEQGLKPGIERCLTGGNGSLRNGILVIRCTPADPVQAKAGRKGILPPPVETCHQDGG